MGSVSAVVGDGFGGYAAMMSVAREPERFRCAVGLNRVSDLYSLVAEVQRYIGGTFLTRYIGRLWDPERLRESSPINQVQRIQTPMLLAASTKDSVVNPKHSRRMQSALKKQGKVVQFVELPDGDHSLSLQANRETFALALLAFLKQHLREPMPQMAEGEPAV